MFLEIGGAGSVGDGPVYKRAPSALESAWRVCLSHVVRTGRVISTPAKRRRRLTEGGLHHHLSNKEMTITKKLIAALMGSLFAIGALTGTAAFADDDKGYKKETTTEEKK